MLDSAGRKKDAAAAYEQFASAYPRDSRAAGALWNAAATYLESGDTATAARAYATFASRYPNEARASQARAQQIALLRSTGDSTAANAALASACTRPTDELKGECTGRVAQRYFDQAVATFRQYQPLKLTITTKGQLTAAGVRRASQRKQTLLKQLTAQFAQAIKTGNPQYLAASSYYVGLAQWEYGNFVKNVELPANLTEEERAAAQQGSAQQAEQYFTSAKQVWQELVQKAEATPAIANDPQAAAWVQRAKNAVQGTVDSTPSASGDR
jgi:hypothetical protein